MENKYKSVAHVRWELPFPIMLPLKLFLCWEPKEGIAGFVPEGQVGSIQWKRSYGLLSSEIVFGEKLLEQDPNIFTKEDFRIFCDSKDLKTKILTAEILHGPDGGFIEARPYTVANIFLCLSFSDSDKDDNIEIRANAALNNLIDVYRLLSMDPILRPIRSQGDHYYTTIAEAVLQESLQHLPPQEILMNVDKLEFGSVIGKGRTGHIGVNSYDDLRGLRLIREGEEYFYSLVKSKQQFELFHLLLFSSFRRLKRKEGALAIIDAQSAFESAVASMLRDGLGSKGLKKEDIENEFKYKGNLHWLNKRLKKLDEIADEFTKKKFANSVAEKEWSENLYELRNEIVHGGRREVIFNDAKKGIVSGLKAINYLHDLCPLFRRSFMWSGEALDLPHIHETAGRLSRIFEY